MQQGLGRSDEDQNAAAVYAVRWLVPPLRRGDFPISRWTFEETNQRRRSLGLVYDAT